MRATKVFFLLLSKVMWLYRKTKTAIRFFVLKLKMLTHFKRLQPKLTSKNVLERRKFRWKTKQNQLKTPNVIFFFFWKNYSICRKLKNAIRFSIIKYKHVYKYEAYTIGNPFTK